MAARRQVGLPVRGYLLSRAEVSHMLDRLRKTPLKARRQIPGLAPDRADIIVAGIAVVDRLMRRFKVNLLQVHSRGVRDGLLLTMIDNTLGTPSTNPIDRDAAIDRFAAACTGDHELAHGKHVAILAGRLFEQLAERFQLNLEDRPFLEAAARLQDVGYLINYDQHHKHSYHLILNSRLAGFRPRELELIANVARYHRGAKPKMKHANFRQLPAEDQKRVEQLAAILRVAGGLDRSHSQLVKDVKVRIPKGASDEIELLLEADFEPEVDLWGARRRTKHFQNVFGVKLSIEWHPPAGEMTPTPNDKGASANSSNGAAAKRGKRKHNVSRNSAPAKRTKKSRRLPR
jgi:exopolyphosphatase / guanosine-5'-triphosphate,3'-diphosphate pyrophosphatase